MQTVLRRMLAAAAVGVVATLVPAGMAVADVNAQVNPSKARAGERITLFAECSATATSDAFGSVRLSTDEGGNAARVTLRRNLKAGNYTVTFRCDDGQSTQRTLEVTGPAKPLPSGGPATGGGGASEGPDGGYIAGGLAAAGVTAGLVVVLVRRGRRREVAGG
jgi:uncharacterized protein (DUF2141 family)